jgi:hypothetical protein
LKQPLVGVVFSVPKNQGQKNPLFLLTCQSSYSAGEWGKERRRKGEERSGEVEGRGEEKKRNKKETG